ncbi:uncharacterized protein BXZ73DRAFT_91646 [Epithele typhae]|uniref:uncharacterized protein n=1 Tax=Epithele typhae TaxID=378194 RepID=UPI002008A8F1|nr:uncharacterized protein BXZ73DRAFT_91646 [Epithele typhae]KAH9921942.1 hypothetical protein BXZ73DRAFT_91646 [Epithele typhae]
MFERATHDETLFPPKCCQTPLEVSAGREFTTADRVYCHIPTCGAFLGPRKAHDSAAVPPSLINDYACTACGDHTCKSCKTAAHPGRACAEADLQRDVLALGRAEGWQRCPACGHLVELNEGCYHITCRCAKQFCYLCAATWKECGCPQFHDPGEVAALPQLRVMRRGYRAL